MTGCANNYEGGGKRKTSVFLLQNGKSQNKVITRFNPIHLHLLKKHNFGDVLPHPHRIFYC